MAIAIKDYSGLVFKLTGVGLINHFLVFQINLRGCRNITNRGVNILRDKLLKLQNVDAAGTQVSVMLPLTSDRLNIGTKLDGCPMVSPGSLSEAMTSNSTMSKHQFYIGKKIIMRTMCMDLKRKKTILKTDSSLFLNIYILYALVSVRIKKFT